MSEPQTDRLVVDLTGRETGGGAVRLNSASYAEVVEASGFAGLPILSAELLRFAAIVFGVDRAFNRRPGLGWFRSFQLTLLTQHTDWWREHGDRWSRLLTFLSGDSWRIDVVEAPEQTYPETLPQSATPDTDAVILFSGGMDSLAGAWQLAHAGQRLTLLHHGKSDQQRALHLAGRLLGEHDLLVIPTPEVASGHQPLSTNERSQRLRSLWYLIVLGFMGVRSGQPAIMAENGLMAYHPVLSSARASSFSTRTAHPAVLRDVSHLMSAATERDVTFANPLIGMTRTETLRQLIETGGTQAALASFTCQRPGGIGRRPCGFCVPCLHRQVACGLVLPQYIEPVEFPAFEQPPRLPAEGHRNLRELLAWTRGTPETRRRDEAWLLSSRLQPDEIQQALGIFQRTRADIRTYLREHHPRRYAAYLRERE